MVNNWRKVVDDSEQLQYEHESSGEFIVANKQPGGGWKIIARDSLGSNRIGTKDTKRSAKSRMKQYMRRNSGSGGSEGGLFGGDSGMDGTSEETGFLDAEAEQDALDDLNPF